MYEKTPISAVILASGKATRLREECIYIPKCLLEFEGIPFLNFLINWLIKSGIERIIVVAYTHKQKIEEEVVKTWSGFDVKIVFEDVLINTVASAYAGLRLVNSENALILTADTIWDLSLTDMIRFHWYRGAKATILVTKRKSVPNLGQIKVFSSGQIASIWDSCTTVIDESQCIKASTMGIYIVNVLKILKSIDISKDSGIEKEPLARLLPEVWAYWCEGLFLDYGTPDKLDYLRNNTTLIKKHFGMYRIEK